MAQIRRASVKNYIEVPPDSVIEMAGTGLATEAVEGGPPRLTVDVGDGLELNSGGQVCINLRPNDNNNRIRVLTNIHHNMDSNYLVIEKVFTIYEIVRTWFGLFLNLVEIETYSVTDRVEMPRAGSYTSIVAVSERSSTPEEPNFYMPESSEVVESPVVTDEPDISDEYTL